MTYFNKALKKIPDNVNLLYNIAVSFYYLYENDKALEYIDKTLAIDPSNTVKEFKDFINQDKEKEKGKIKAKEQFILEKIN